MSSSLSPNSPYEPKLVAMACDRSATAEYQLMIGVQSNSWVSNGKLIIGFIIINNANPSGRITASDMYVTEVILKYLKID